MNTLCVCVFAVKVLLLDGPGWNVVPPGNWHDGGWVLGHKSNPRRCRGDEAG